ncbi:hypothetical protein LguiA_011691 [Lonicera macranthoides]
MLSKTKKNMINSNTNFPNMFLESNQISMQNFTAIEIKEQSINEKYDLNEFR